MTGHRANTGAFRGYKVKELRKQCGMTQKELGKKICNKRVSGIESGRQYPCQDLEDRICNYFGVESKYFRAD